MRLPSRSKRNVRLMSIAKNSVLEKSAKFRDRIALTTDVPVIIFGIRYAPPLQGEATEY